MTENIKKVGRPRVEKKIVQFSVGCTPEMLKDKTFRNSVKDFVKNYKIKRKDVLG